MVGKKLIYFLNKYRDKTNNLYFINWMFDSMHACMHVYSCIVKLMENKIIQYKMYY